MFDYSNESNEVLDSKEFDVVDFHNICMALDEYKNTLVIIRVTDSFVNSGKTEGLMTVGDGSTNEQCHMSCMYEGMHCNEHMYVGMRAVGEG